MRSNINLRLLGFAFALAFLPATAFAQGTLKCESNDGRRNYCGSYDAGEVRFDRQISGSPCIEGRTWGVDGRGLWVDRGCRATFIIRGNSNRGGDRYRGGGGGGPDIVKCESNDSGREYCGSYRADQVRLDRQISGSPCIEGRSWGVDGRGLWVDRGCRATFAIRGGSGGGGFGDRGGGFGGGGGIPYESRVRVDTSGHGNFSGDRQSVRITRGWVDTTGQAYVALSGEGNFKITFRGPADTRDGRNFTMRITDSDRGNASGSATFRLNGDQNEVQSISVSGRLNGRSFSGSFSR